MPPRGMATGSRVAEGEELRDLALEAVVSPRQFPQLPTRMSGEPYFATRQHRNEVRGDPSLVCALWVGEHDYARQRFPSLRSARYRERRHHDLLRRILPRSGPLASV